MFFALFGLLLSLGGPIQHGVLDPAFEKIPFEQWLSEHEKNAFRASVAVSRPELTFHQRLAASVEIQVDGKDLETRRHGELVFYVQIVDQAGARYENHGSLDLTKLDDNIKAANIQYSYLAFFLPGEYRLAVAIVDTATDERTVIHGHFHIAEYPQASLVAEWRGLPPVEFIRATESPDSWYLPGVKGRLAWASGVQAATHLNVILTIATSVTTYGSHGIPNGGLAALLPALKVISHPSSAAISETLELLDLNRRRAVFKQENAGDLDWRRLKTALAEGNTASIDVRSLAESHHDAQFFVSEVRRLLRDSPQSCKLVVLSTPIAFAPGEDLAPISLEALPPCSVTYIRYHALRPFQRMFDGPTGRFGSAGRAGRPPVQSRSMPEVSDRLAATLKPLNPKVLDVDTPEQMNRALAEIEKRF